MKMKLFSVHAIANKNTNNNNSYMMPIMYTKSKPAINQIPESLPQVPIDPPKKVKWGEPIWYLFHTLSVKIRESEFQKIRTELLNNIYVICVNLPCPDCANHAKLYLDNINFNAIQTKEDLKKMLYEFHNSVNKRKGYPFFPYEQVHQKYSLAITNNIIVTAMAHFSDRNRTLKLLASDLYRSRLCIMLKEWFNKHIHSFEP